MPKIPVYERQQTASLDVPSNNFVAGEGRLQQLKEQEQLINSTKQLANDVADLHRERQKAEARDYSFDSFNRDAQAYNEFEKKSKAQGLDGHGERSAQWWEQRQGERVKNAPSDLAAKAYREDVQNLQLKSITSAKDYEYIEKAKYNFFKYKTEEENYAAQAISNPRFDPVNMTFTDYEIVSDQFANSMRKDTGAFSPAEVEDKIKDMRNGLLIGHYQGLEHAEQYDVMEKLLNSDGRVSTDLDPKVKDHLLDLAKRGQERKSAKEATKLKAFADEVSFNNANGKLQPEKTMALISAIRANKSIDKDTADREIDTLRGSLEVGKATSELIKLPEAKWYTVDTSLQNTSGFNPIARNRLQNEMYGAMREIQKKRKEDPAGAALDSSTKLQELRKKAAATPNDRLEYIDELRAEQQRLGISLDNIRITDKNESANIALGLNQVLDKGSPEAVAQYVESVNEHYGPHAPKVYEELVKDGHADKGFYLVGQVDTIAARNAIVYNLKNSKQLNDSYKTQFGDTSNSLIMEEARKSTSEAASILNQSGTDIKLGDAFIDQVALEAKSIKLRQNIDESQAVAIAKQKIVDANYEVVPGGRSSVLMPRSNKTVSNEQLKAFLSRSNSSRSNLGKEELAKFNPVIPDNYNNIPGGKDKYLEDLSKRSRWILSLDGKSLSLVEDYAGETNPVGTIPGANINSNVPMLEKGNIDLTKRPRVRNADGSISTVRSTSVNIDGKEVLLPTVSDEGKIISTKEAVNNYINTGKHLGIFPDSKSATEYAKQLHESQAAMLSNKKVPIQIPLESIKDIDYSIVKERQIKQVEKGSYRR